MKTLQRLDFGFLTGLAFVNGFIAMCILGTYNSPDEFAVVPVIGFLVCMWGLKLCIDRGME